MKALAKQNYSEVIRSIAALRNLRKIKMFYKMSTVTLVTYYKDATHTHEFIGRAYIIDLFRLSSSTISLAHNNKTLGPPREEDEDGEETQEESTETPQPAIGALALAT